MSVERDWDSHEYDSYSRCSEGSMNFEVEGRMELGGGDFTQKGGDGNDFG